MNSNSRTTNSIRNILIGFIGQFLQIGLGFVNRTIFIKVLSSEYLGVNGLFSNILSVLSLAELGVGSAITYALYKPLAENNEKELSALMKFYSKAYKIIGLVIGLVGIGFMPFLNFMIKQKPNIIENINIIYAFYLFNTIITYFFSYKTAIISADQKSYINSIISYAINIIQTIVQIVILVTTKNFLLYLLIQTIFIMFYNILISKISSKMYPCIKRNSNEKLTSGSKRSLIKNIKALMIVKLSGVLVNNTDNIIITYFSGLSAVGLCSNYNLLIGVINSAISQVFSGITASVGNLNAKESKERQREFFDILNFANFWIFGFSAISIVILINDVIMIWLGSEFLLNNGVPIILAVNFYMVGLQNAVWTFKNTMGLFVRGKYLLVVTAIVNLVLSFLLGKKYDLFGILLATAIARAITNTWYDPYVVCKYGLNMSSTKYFKRYFKYILILLITFFATNWICSLIKVNSIFTLIIKTFLCFLVINIIFIIIFRKDKEFQYFKKLVLIYFEKFGQLGNVFRGIKYNNN